MENSKVRRFNNPKKMDIDVTQSEMTTCTTYLNYLHRLSVLAQSRFTWTNLPPLVTSRLIERTLFTHGQFVMYKHGGSVANIDTEFDRVVLPNNDNSIYNGRFFALPFTHDSLDMYGDPVNLNAYGLNGYQHSVVSGLTGVIFRNNCLATNTVDTVTMFAARMTAAMRTQDLNIYGQRKTALFVCPEEQRLTLKKMMAKVDRFDPWILGVKNVLDVKDNIKVINAEIPYIADRLTSYKNDLWEEVLSFFGISSGTTKKERMIENEVTSNNHLATASINTMLESRRESMREFNDMYGMNIDVHVNDVDDDVFKTVEVLKGGEPVAGYV